VKSKFNKLLFKYLLVAKTNKIEGFTLIELLVVIVIIGILAATALPSFLNQASRARQSEGRTYLSAIVRAQQAYLIEKKRFACDGEILALGITSSTNN
jgi:type IV pilus assembly protein PilA